MRFSLMTRLLSTSSWFAINAVWRARNWQRALSNDVSMAALKRGGAAS